MGKSEGGGKAAGWAFRELKATDLFPIAKVLSKIGVNRFMDAFGSEAVQRAIERFSGGEPFGDMEAVVVGGAAVLQITQVILENLDKCEAELFALLSSTSGLTLVEVRDLGLEDFIDMIVGFVRLPEFAGFFRRASALLR